MLQESFASLVDHMAQGFENLGKLFQGQENTASSVHSERAETDSVTELEAEAELSEDGDQEHEDGPSATKRQKTSNVSENDQIIDMLGKAYNVQDGQGPTLNSNLAKIVEKLLKDRPNDAKLTEIIKRYLTPDNCERLAETRVNSPIWNNLSDQACTADIKLQKVQKSLVRGVAALVSVVNSLVTGSQIPPKEEIVHTLTNGVLLLANSNI